MLRWRRIHFLKKWKRYPSLASIKHTFEEMQRHALFVILVGSLCFLWLIYSMWDPCDGRTIITNLCKEYDSGEVAGHLCSLICREHSVSLSYCLENGPRKSFLFENMIIRVSERLEKGQSEEMLKEGMLPDEFNSLLITYLQSQLGQREFVSLVNNLKTFADFNEDGQISLGEAQSLWRLVHTREFLILFIFQGSIVFPALNGSCGSVFGFNFPQVPAIFNMESFSILNLMFSDAYQLYLPTWEQRAKVTVGILDLVFDIYEMDSIRFFFCDLKSTSIGYTEKYETVVTDAESIMSSIMLESALQNRTCLHDHDCQYSQYCTAACDPMLHKCTGETTKPTLWQACELMKKFLMFDAPEKIKPILEKLLYRCSQLVIYGQSVEMSHVVLIADIKSVLWDLVKHLNLK